MNALCSRHKRIRRRTQAHLWGVLYKAHPRGVLGGVSGTLKLGLLVGLVALFVSIATTAYAVTEFVCTINKTGEDYSTLTAWEAAIQCDLTAATTKVIAGSLTAGAINDVRGYAWHGTYQYPRQLLEKLRRTLMLKEQFQPCYQSSLFDGGQIKKPKMNENAIIVNIPTLTISLKSRKNPLTQAATIVSLNISKHALEIASRRLLLNSFITLIKTIILDNFCQGKITKLTKETSYA